jgi:hypothetical protein
MSRREDLLTTGITIGRFGNTIKKHPDESMIFSDPYVPGVKLKDLFEGKVVIDPAIFVEVNSSDWIPFIANLGFTTQLQYNIEIPHDWNLCEPLLCVNIWNTDNKEIRLNSVVFRENSIYLESTINMPIKVVLKRL